MVDDTGSTQALHSGGVDGSRGRIGGEGIGGMDVVIDILGNHGRELGGLQDLLQVRQTLFLGGSVELVQDIDVDHGIVSFDSLSQRYPRT